MRRVLAIVAVLAGPLALAPGCSFDEETPTPDPEPQAVTLTGDERDDFVRRLVDLGYTCREALPESTAELACTRPGTPPEAVADTVTIRSSEGGEQVLGVAYCGPEPGVVPAFSEAFLGEVDSPELLPDPPGLRGLDLQVCRSESGEGIRVGGPGVPVLRELNVVLLRQSLRQRGWTCRDDLTVDCTLATSGGEETLVWGTSGEIKVVARSARDLAAATQVLGLSPIVAEAARSCRPETVCDHLLVDGFDLFFEVEGPYHRMLVRERKGF